MKPEQIIDQFTSTVALISRKKFLRDEDRYHQIVGAYDMAQAMVRLHPDLVHENTELPEHSVSTQLSELEQLFRNFCVPLHIPPEGQSATGESDYSGSATHSSP